MNIIQISSGIKIYDGFDGISSQLNTGGSWIIQGFMASFISNPIKTKLQIHKSSFYVDYYMNSSNANGTDSRFV